MTKRAWFGLILALVVAVALPACSSDTDGDSGAATCETCTTMTAAGAGWCESCSKGMYDGKEVGCKGCYDVKKGDAEKCET